MDTSSKIFVQIASYRDLECQWTVRDLFEKAASPERITVGICWQFIPEVDKHCFEIETRASQVRIESVNALESKGVCWARHRAQQLWDGEKYALQIDSHMRFEEGWDVKLIEELSLCKTAKPLLSCDPPHYSPPNSYIANPKNAVRRPNQLSKNGEMRCGGVQIDFIPSVPIRGAIIAAGFIFSDAKIIKEIPYDPYLYFDQEEGSLSARLYTHGWDIFCPRQIILYHYYVDSKQNARPLHWLDVKEWDQMRNIGIKRYRHLMGQEHSDDPDVIVDLDKYAMGNSRNLDDYCAFSGVDFPAEKVSDKALLCGFIEDLNKYLKSPLKLS